MKNLLRLLILAFPVLCMAQSAGIVQQWNGRPAIGVFQITPLPTITWTPTITPTPQNTPSGTSPTWTATATATSTSTLTPTPTATPQIAQKPNGTLTGSFDCLSGGVTLHPGGVVTTSNAFMMLSAAPGASPCTIEGDISADGTHFSLAADFVVVTSGNTTTVYTFNSDANITTPYNYFRLRPVFTPTQTVVITYNYLYVYSMRPHYQIQPGGYYVWVEFPNGMGPTAFPSSKHPVTFHPEKYI